jgi:FAD synthetase
MRPALEAYLGEKPAVKAIFVGTRRTDPHGKFLKHFDPTDKDWPQFMRVHPVIDWHYAEIWAVSTFFLYLFRFVFGFWRRDEEAAG